MSLSNPLNLLLIPPILFLIIRIYIPGVPEPPKKVTKYDPDVYNWMPAERPKCQVYKDYTPIEMSIFDGKDGGKILLAIMKVGRDLKVNPEGERTIFDVTNGRNFYGPGEFVGRC
jgi:membrane-associated progesterone receptor component